MIDTKAIRAKILEFAISEEQWPTETLESIIRTIPSKPYQVLESEVTMKGRYRVISQSKEFSIGYSEDATKVYHHDQPVIVFGDHTTVIKYIDFDFIVGADGVKILEPNYSIVHPKYLYYMILHQLMDFIESGGYARHYRYVKKFEIPIPPLTEQRNIAERVESCFSILDTIDTLQSQYQDNLATLKSKIIDAGIQGKLTEQLPEDGTAEELYQQIQQEKLALEKAGKIKKSKPLPPISDEEKPFDIPDNWKWVSVGDVCTNIQYGTSKKSSETGKMPVIRMGNLQGGKIVYDKLAYTSDDNEIAKYPLEINDLLFNRTNSMELVGKTAIYKGEMPAIYAGYLVRITPLLLVSDYLNYVMQTKYYWDYCRIVRIDANGQSNINAEKLKRFVFPLPPLTEQKRIVAKLEELLPLCEG